jgi:hypothetical protein
LAKDNNDDIDTNKDQEGSMDKNEDNINYHAIDRISSE